MSDLNNIEKLFQEQFENFEMPVRASLWSQVAAGAGIGKAVFWTTSKIIAAAFVGVVVVSVGSWYLLKTDKSTDEIAIVQPTIDQVVDNEISESGASVSVSEEIKTAANNFVDNTLERPRAIEGQPQHTYTASQDRISQSLDMDKTELFPSLTTSPDFGIISSVDVYVEPAESQYATFEPAPTEKLNLEILIAPNKSDEKTLEQIHFPHAFVKIFNPRLSGEAGQFSIQSKDLGTFEIEIRTRSGKLVYKSTDPNFIWRGEQMDGSEAPEGTYMYTIFATTNSGQPLKPQLGSVFLMRK